MNIQDKIQKLLALSASPNENEARAALLKARQLMAENKLTEEDVREIGKRQVVERLTDASFTTLTNAWPCDLSTIIANKYCCRSFCERVYGGKTGKIGFFGLEDDIAVCERVFRYAYDFVIAEGERQISGIRKKVWTGRQIREAKEAYGFGFTAGVYAAFREQDKQHQDWALVLSTPKAVLDELERLKLNTKNPPVDKSKDKSELLGFRAAGYAAGTEFDPSTKLEN